MKVSDLVDVVEKLGCTGEHTRRHGLGIIVSIEEYEPLRWGKDLIGIGRQVTVMTYKGVKKFHESDVHLVSKDLE